MESGCERAEWRVPSHTKGWVSQSQSWGGKSLPGAKSLGSVILFSPLSWRRPGEEEGGRGEEVKAGWRWRWGGEGQRGECRAKGCDDDDTQRGAQTHRQQHDSSLRHLSDKRLKSHENIHQRVRSSLLQFMLMATRGRVRDWKLYYLCFLLPGEGIISAAVTRVSWWTVV